MSSTREPQADRPLLLRLYVLAAIGGLSALFLTLWARGLLLWSLLPVLAGALALALRWRAGIGLVLILLGVLLFGEGYGQQRLFFSPRPVSRPRGPFGVTDLLVAASFLTYAAAHARLMALTLGIFPHDPRITAAARARRLQRKRRRPGNDISPLESLPLPAQRRSAPDPDSNELLYLLLSLPIWVGLAIPAWLWLRTRRPGLPMTPELWRAFVFLWALGLVLVLARAVFAYLRQSTLTVEEARLYLQDVVWQETRAEQRLLNRWLDGARQRLRRKEKS